MYAIFIISAVFSVAAIALAIHGGRIDKKMDEVSLYRVASSLVVASILAGVICFFAICYSLSGYGSGAITSQDAIVDILGILVIVLMGWNIISLVDFKRKADEIDYIKQDFKSVVGGFMQLNFDSFITKGRKHELLDNCFNALTEIHSCLNDNIRLMAEDKLMCLIKQACDDMVANNNALIYPGKRNIYLHILSHIDSIYTKDIEEFIKMAKEDQQEYAQNVQEDSAKSNSLEVASSN